MVSVFCIRSKVRGYHIYHSIWPYPFVREVSCEQEAGNSHDPQAVTMTKLIDGNVEVVGHVPQTISSICSLFIRRGRSITCKVTRSREYSSDLEQGGIQLPCKLTFCIADSLEFQKTRISFRMVSTDTLEVNEAMETEQPEAT